MYQQGKTLLRLTDVSLKFGNNLILRDINLEVRDILRETVTGQVSTLIGESGIGKTQLMKMIAALQQPSGGSILIGEDQHPVKVGEVGLVFQNYPLLVHRTLNGNLNLVCKEKEKIDFYLNEFNLYQHKDKYPAQLSGGQRQRTSIVQQILCSEHFILLDEPFSGLDLKAIEKLCQVIMKVASMDELNTVVISSHILEPSLAVSDHVWILGYELDEQGNKIPGAVIRFSQSLADEGLAWRENIKEDPNFMTFCKLVERTFKSL